VVAVSLKKKIPLLLSNAGRRILEYAGRRILESAGKIITGDEKTTFFALVIVGFARNHHFHLRS
jgi:hypothetical protein